MFGKPGFRNLPPRKVTPPQRGANPNANRPAPASEPVRSGKSKAIGFAASVMIAFMVVPPGLDFTAHFQASGGDIFGPIILLGSLLLSLSIYFSNRKQCNAVLKETNPFFLALIVLATVSYFWSYDPGITIHRWMRIYAFVLVGLAVAVKGWHRSRVQEVLRNVLTMLLVGSLIFGMLYPELAIHQEDLPELKGAWRGLTTQKNTLGALSGFTLILWLHALAAKKNEGAKAIFGAVIALTCTILSRSSTSLIAGLFCGGVLYALIKLPRAVGSLLPFIVYSITSLVIIFSLAVLKLVPGSEALLSPIVSATGKDLTFSGRSAIWEIVLDSINGHRWLGCGYGAYWTANPDSDAYLQFINRKLVYPGEGHNGYLDVINELGYIGGFFLIAYIIYYIWQSLKLVKYDKEQAALFIALMLFELIGNVTEAHWFSAAAADFPIMAIVTFALAAALQKANSA